MTDVDERQAREISFHQEYAERNSHKLKESIPFDIIQSPVRRPWNAYWCTYDALLAIDMSNKKVLVPGCGFGDDAIRLARLGADVYATDLSEDVLSIARVRADRHRQHDIKFSVMPAESLDYDSGMFDAVFFNDILHHVDIPRALKETTRVAKRNSHVIINELYTHSNVQYFRNARFVKELIYPRMTKFIYGTSRPYITDDERKINESELSDIISILQPGFDIDFFLFLEGRILPARWPRISRMDRGALKFLGPYGRFLAGRFVLVGALR